MILFASGNRCQQQVFSLDGETYISPWQRAVGKRFPISQGLKVRDKVRRIAQQWLVEPEVGQLVILENLPVLWINVVAGMAVGNIVDYVMNERMEAMGTLLSRRTLVMQT